MAPIVAATTRMLLLGPMWGMPPISADRADRRCLVSGYVVQCRLWRKGLEPMPQCFRGFCCTHDSLHIHQRRGGRRRPPFRPELGAIHAPQRRARDSDLAAVFAAHADVARFAGPNARLKAVSQPPNVAPGHTDSNSFFAAQILRETKGRRKPRPSNQRQRSGNESLVPLLTTSPFTRTTGS
jgi:hypothetical protein